MNFAVKQINALQARLSNANISEVIQLPQMVVVGNQSAGKSSALESIIGFEMLPKGEGIVTKCPIRIQMNQITTGQEYSTFAHLPNERFTFDQVPSIIIKRSDELTSNKCLSYDEITVNLFSTEMINLTLVDVPGITAVRSANQPEDFVEQVKSMVRTKIENEFVLILAIIAANDDVANSVGLALAQTVDPNGLRTIGIFTKLDKMTSKSLADHVSQMLYRLPLGYVGVVCRSKEDIEAGISLQNFNEKGKAFYESKEECRKNPEFFGFSALRTKLDKEFKKHILLSLPKLRESVDNKIIETNQKLSKISVKIPDITHLESYTHQIIDEFFNQCDGLLDGSLVSIEHETYCGGVLFRNRFIEFYLEMDNITDLLNMPTKKAKTIIQNKSGLQGIYPISESLITSILRNNIILLKPFLMKCVNQVAKIYDKYIEMVKIKEVSFYKNLKRCFQKKILDVKNKNLLILEEKINFLMELECEYTDPELVGSFNSSQNLSPDALLNVIVKTYFLAAKKSLKENTTKYIKHFFIKKNLLDTRMELHKYINKLSEADIENLFEEASQIGKERDMLLQTKATYEEIQYELKGIEIDFS